VTREHVPLPPLVCACASLRRAARAVTQAYDAEREQADSDDEQNSVVGHFEDPDEDDAEAGEGDERSRHHQSKTGFLGHDQMTASRRSRSISSAR